MSNSTKPMRVRAMTVAGGIALIGATGAGMSSSANAASTSSASSTLAKIKYCESGGNYQAVNSSSGASGAYQFLNSTWRGLSAAKGYSTAASAPAAVQDAAALELYSQSGTSPWAASSSCWSKLTSTPTSTTTTATTTSATKTTAAKSSTTATQTSTKSSAKTTAPAKSSAATQTAKAKPQHRTGVLPNHAAPLHGGAPTSAMPTHAPGHPATAGPRALPHGKAHAPKFPKVHGGKHQKKLPLNLTTKGANTLPKAA